MNPTTPLQDEILEALRDLGGSATTTEIATRLGKKPRSVSNSLQFLRGYGYVNDGSKGVAIADTNGNLAGIAWSPGPTPIRWTLNER